MILGGILIGIAFWTLVTLQTHSRKSKTRLQRLPTRELYQKKQQYRQLWILMLAIAIIGPIPFSTLTALTNDPAVSDFFTGITATMVMAAVGLCFMFLRYRAIAVAEIEYRQSQDETDTASTDNDG